MLRVLHREIAARARSIAESRGDWPCRKGCAQCCRRLAAIPELTRPEWELLAQGYNALSGEVKREVVERLEGLRDARAPYTCPFLERESGSCLVYHQRPIACGTYGFYVERDRGLYCIEIEARVASGEFADVVWGNVAAVAAAMEQHGAKLPILQYARFFRVPADAGVGVSTDNHG